MPPDMYATTLANLQFRERKIYHSNPKPNTTIKQNQTCKNDSSETSNTPHRDPEPGRQAR